jgi:pimeloyl-ACP methyl ester carboxylesterase
MTIEKKTCTVSGNTIAYLHSGSGEPVLLVHGITTYSFIWRKIIPSLAVDYEVFAIDLLGCGESDKPLNVSYSIKDHAERLREFASTLGIRKLHFVGHDLGGGMGQILAVRFPDLLYDLTMINTVGYDYWPVQPIISLRTPIFRQFLMATMDIGAFGLIIKRGLYHKERFNSELMNLFMKPMLKPGGRKAFLHFAKCLNNQDLMEIEKELRELALPVLIIRGNADPYLGEVISEKLHREIPGSVLIRIPTGGHFIQEDEPEQLVHAIKSFFKRELHLQGIAPQKAGYYA